MVTKTFICDICKLSVGETELCTVDVSVTYPQDRYNKLLSCKKDICKECLKKKGIVAERTGERVKDEQTAASNQKTFEQKFTDFLEDLGVAFVE
jgi:hypothetical protein